MALLFCRLNGCFTPEVTGEHRGFISSRSHASSPSTITSHRLHSPIPHITAAKGYVPQELFTKITRSRTQVWPLLSESLPSPPLHLKLVRWIEGGHGDVDDLEIAHGAVDAAGADHDGGHGLEGDALAISFEVAFAL